MKPGLRLKTFPPPGIELGNARSADYRKGSKIASHLSSHSVYMCAVCGLLLVCVCASFPVGFEGRIWALIVFVPVYTGIC